MPASFTPVDDPAALPGAYWFDWAHHPALGPLPTPLDLTIAEQDYLFHEFGVQIDLGGPAVTVSRCSAQGFDAAFATNDGVLLGDNLAGRLPLHLLFQTPLRGLGTQISAVGPVGQGYLAQLLLRLDDGSWQTFAQPAQLRRQRNTAPFLGALCSDGRRIVEAAFDVVDPANQADFPRVAISALYVVP